MELVEITIFTELLSDLMGQLVSYAYLRERDLMYMQLGFQYVKLFHTQSVEQDSIYRKLNGPEISIQNGAILYQIVAMYTYHLPVFDLNENGIACLSKEKVSTGKNIELFANVYGDATYYEGLCFFEDVHMHNYIVNFRNYIDHFKYYAATDKSILDMYSQMYDCFFGYDLKLQKSISFVLSNILMNYFVVPRLSFTQNSTKTYKSDITKKTYIKKAAKIEILEPLKSDIFSFKLPNEQGEVLAKARSEVFLEQVSNILKYSNVK